jgi:uncharacterized protein
MKGRIVADSSPLIALSNIGELRLLRHSFAQVVVPPMVGEEIACKEPPSSDWFGLLAEGIVRIQPLRDARRLPLLRLRLDPGESEAILLAQEIGLPLLMDERAGRDMAQLLGVRVIGLAGALRAWSKAGLIPVDAMPSLVQRLERANFRLGPGLKQWLLEG